MTPEDIRNYIKDTVYTAVQSTKEENSGLIGDIQRILNKEIAKAIELNVNGKIRAIDTKFDTYVREDNEYKENKKETDDIWRKGVDDKLEIVTNLQGFGRVSLYVMGFVALLGTVVGLVFKFLK